MFTISKIYGIGEVTEENDKMITVYFEESDVEKKLLKEFVTIYPTIEEADAALNPEMTEERVSAILSEIEDKKRIMKEGVAAQRRLEEIEIERSINLKKHI